MLTTNRDQFPIEKRGFEVRENNPFLHPLTVEEFFKEREGCIKDYTGLNDYGVHQLINQISQNLLIDPTRDISQLSLSVISAEIQAFLEKINKIPKFNLKTM